MVPTNVVVLPEAAAELRDLPSRERAAVVNAVEKLTALGDGLRFPHCSAVMGTEGELRELRPRQGNSPWRVFYGTVDDELLVAAVGPEAQQDLRGFKRAVQRALERLAAYAAERDDEQGNPV